VLLPLIIALTLAPDAPSPRAYAWRVARDAQRAVESGTDARFERRWRLAVAAHPNDRRALLALATLARLRYRYTLADSLYRRASDTQPIDSAYVAAADLGMALSRALGSDQDSAISLFDRARSAAQAVGDSEIVVQSLIGLAQLRARKDGPRTALQLVRSARAWLGRLTFDVAAQLDCTEGAFADRTGDSTGRSRAIQGRQSAAELGAIGVWANCDMFVAQVEERAASLDHAEHYAKEALALFQRAHDLVGVAQASQWLGYLLAERGYFAEGEANLQRALRAAEATHYTRVEAWARFDLAAYVYLPLGDVERAHAEAARAVVLHARQGDSWGVANDKKLEGLLLQSEGHLDDASTQFAAAVVAFRNAGIMFNSVEPLRLLAVANMRIGRLDSAERALDDATRLAATSGVRGWSDELPIHRARLALLRGDPAAADSLLRASRSVSAWRRGDGADLWTLPAAVLEAQLALRLHRVATADSAVAFVSAEIARRRTGETNRDLRAGLAQLNGDWGVELSDAYSELVAGLASSGRLASAFRFIESVRAREIADVALRTIGRMSDSAAALAGFRRLSATASTVSLADARAALAPDKALIVLTLGLNEAPTTAMIVMRDSAFAISLPGRAALTPLIDRYLRVAAGGAEPIAVGRQLGAMLLDPIARAVPARVTRLEISPDGDLFRVPFDALRLAGDRFAVDRFAISLVPSATVAQALRALPATGSATRLIAIGDPAFAPDMSLARLPRSADEARRVAAYGRSSTVLIGDMATETAVRSANLQSAGVLHFATHALVDARGQSRTALALTPGASDDGLLTTSEIASLHLNGALVVLSACQSLGGQILGGEGLRGLSEPFLEAGARAVVVTQWSIGDKSVLPFVDRFYASMAAGASAGDALRATKMAAIRDGASIADWAAFTIIGDASIHPPLRLRRLSPMEWLQDLVQPRRDTSAARSRENDR